MGKQEMNKTVSIAILAALVTAAGCDGGRRERRDTGQAKQADIAVSGAWALYPMMVRWVEAYSKTNSGARIDVSAGGAGKGITDVLAGAVDIAMVSRELHQEEIDKGAWAIPVVKDAVVITVNAGNPCLKDIMSKGLSRQSASAIWTTGTATNWQQIGAEISAPIRVYTRSDACGAAETLAAWLGVRQEDLRGVAVYGDPGVAEAVRRDSLAIGYNNIAFAYDLATGETISGLRILPLDADGNGTADPEELVVENLKKISAAVADGRYPFPPARILNLVTKGRPERPEVIEFLEWILAEGQDFAEQAGYVALDKPGLVSARQKLLSK